jgi:putative endonuclease
VRRVAAHNAGRGGRYTRTHRPVALVYQEEVPDRKSAMRREVAIKAYTRDRKERLIAERSSPAYGSIHETDITAPAEGTGARDDSQP